MEKVWFWLENVKERRRVEDLEGDGKMFAHTQKQVARISGLIRIIMWTCGGLLWKRQWSVNSTKCGWSWSWCNLTWNVGFTAVTTNMTVQMCTGFSRVPDVSIFSVTPKKTEIKFDDEHHSRQADCSPIRQARTFRLQVGSAARWGILLDSCSLKDPKNSAQYTSCVQKVKSRANDARTSFIGHLSSVCLVRCHNPAPLSWSR